MDGHKALHEDARSWPGAILPRPPRADGGIGRRARLRAWSGLTGWRFESSSAHLGKPRRPGLFAFSADGLVRSAAASDAYVATGATESCPTVAPRSPP